jgi:hypothetical protein
VNLRLRAQAAARAIASSKLIMPKLAESSSCGNAKGDRLFL